METRPLLTRLKHCFICIPQYTTTYRKAAHAKLIEAINRAVEESHATTAITTVAHSADSHTITTAASSLEQQFKQNVLQKYSTAQDAWQVFNSISGGEGISRTDFKTVLAMLGIKGTATKEKGALRKKMDLQVVRGTVTPCAPRSFTFSFPHVLEHQNHHIRGFFGNDRWGTGQSS